MLTSFLKQTIIILNYNDPTDITTFLLATLNKYQSIFKLTSSVHLDLSLSPE